MSWTATSGAQSWLFQHDGDNPTKQDNVLWEDVPIQAGETSSVQADPDFKTYDPANKLLTLNKISRGDATDSPAFGEGFVDIAGVTDGGTYVWGSPVSNSNSGYDRSNY